MDSSSESVKDDKQNNLKKRQFEQTSLIESADENVQAVEKREDEGSRAQYSADVSQIISQLPPLSTEMNEFDEEATDDEEEEKDENGIEQEEDDRDVEEDTDEYDDEHNEYEKQDEEAEVEVDQQEEEEEQEEGYENDEMDEDDDPINMELIEAEAEMKRVEDELKEARRRYNKLEKMESDAHEEYRNSFVRKSKNNESNDERKKDDNEESIREDEEQKSNNYGKYEKVKLELKEAFAEIGRLEKEVELKEKQWKEVQIKADKAMGMKKLAEIEEDINEIREMIIEVKSTGNEFDIELAESELRAKLAERDRTKSIVDKSDAMLVNDQKLLNEINDRYKEAGNRWFEYNEELVKLYQIKDQGGPCVIPQWTVTEAYKLRARLSFKFKEPIVDPIQVPESQKLIDIEDIKFGFDGINELIDIISDKIVRPERFCIICAFGSQESNKSNYASELFTYVKQNVEIKRIKYSYIEANSDSDFKGNSSHILRDIIFERVKPNGRKLSDEMKLQDIIPGKSIGNHDHLIFIHVNEFDKNMDFTMGIIKAARSWYISFGVRDTGVLFVPILTGSSSFLDNESLTSFFSAATSPLVYDIQIEPSSTPSSPPSSLGVDKEEEEEMKITDEQEHRTSSNSDLQ